jgi:hypothetical protein
MRLERLSDTRRWPFVPRPHPVVQFSGKVVRPFRALWQTGAKAVRASLRIPQPRQVVDDPWQYARNRFNTIAYIRLKDRSSSKQFAVGTYHMPCVFWCGSRTAPAPRPPSTLSWH